ncbi:hypothetical protein CHS0354_042196 [Potamilus streckersoni]|uniref:Uncharacterized protein n=1 Tax=Potamilus streckersoni TaxID=2493646 RepID=A0AAE0TP66_9BIVA|nr:hypothetical protein CHS0354_042196 [Potamilus streckersoni]
MKRSYKKNCSEKRRKQEDSRKFLAKLPKVTTFVTTTIENITINGTKEQQEPGTCASNANTVEKSYLPAVLAYVAPAMRRLHTRQPYMILQLQMRLYLFSSTDHRWTILTEHGKKFTLKALSTTRWECRIEAV